MVQPHARRELIAAVAGITLVALSSCGGTSTGPDTASPGFTTPPPLGGPSLRPQGPVVSGSVVRVVDGDTVRVLVDGQREDISVRMIGIDTPETVAPGRPVECFGPEASEFATQVLDGNRVVLELDPSQGETDRFGRTLAYVWVDNGGEAPVLFNLAAVLGGFARQAQYAQPYAWQPDFIRAERAARQDKRGRWGSCPESVSNPG